MDSIKFWDHHCARKKAFRSEDRAAQIAAKINKKYNNNIAPYYCAICHNWHNGHPKEQATVPRCPILKNKIQYNTEEAARAATPGKSVFLCKTCNKWHTTSTSKRFDKQMTYS